ncbi:MAG: alpha-amylase [Propionibacteriaceae bacterium]|jgi:alpha-glucosidase|nr:alpha-amylase [Propionibacteriaceae bacterium]
MAFWWYGAVLYHVYLRSFRDSNGDGYGDLGGLLAGLDHIAALGADAIWLSPVNPSPDTDWGYDVSDYCAVHPELGTLAQLDEVIAEAAARGMRVLLDLVPNHTSDQHAWFLDARTARDAVHRDYYVWADPKNGGPPNNWLDDTGEPAWDWDGATGQYYLHNFLPTQPDLNWRNPQVGREFDAIMDFWCDRGVAGFRIDVANGLFKDAALRDNPSNAELLPGHLPVPGSHGQQHIYNYNQPEVHGVYRHWRARAAERTPQTLLLGETWVLHPSQLAEYYGDGDELQLAFNFPLIFACFSAREFARVIAETFAALPPGACPIWAGSNHDLPRLGTRWAGGDQAKMRLAHTVLALLPGVYGLYYGDELGMADSDIPAELQRDPLTLGGKNGQWPRDNARSPMRWTPDGGFTTGEPWLPLGPDPSLNVASQDADPDSMLSFTRDLLALRRAIHGGQLNGYEQLHVDDAVFAFATGPAVVVANFSGEEVSWAGVGETGTKPVAPWSALVYLVD